MVADFSLFFTRAEMVGDIYAIFDAAIRRANAEPMPTARQISG